MHRSLFDGSKIMVMYTRFLLSPVLASGNLAGSGIHTEFNSQSQSKTIYSLIASPIGMTA